MDLNKLREAVEAIYDEVVAIRRDIHMHPELSEHEERTMGLICEHLTKLGIPYEANVGGYGVVGIIGDPNASHAVGIRADIDALPVQEANDIPYASQVPGVMHACGHDIHTAVLLGAAKILKSMESELNGAVKLFFQPAEETIGGANLMVQHGCLENPKVTRMLSLHADPNYPVGSVLLMPGRANASTTSLEITVNGVACHGAHPDQGIDAIVVASHVILALQTISSRFAAPTTPVIVTLGVIQGGTKENIVAGSVQLSGTIRALDFETRDFIKAHVKQIAEGTAAAFGGSAIVEMEDGYPPLINDKATTARFEEVAEAAIGRKNIYIAENPSLGADDFAYFSEKVPSTYFNIGTAAPDAKQPQMLHSEFFCPDEGSMKVGILMEVLGALTFLEEDKNK